MEKGAALYARPAVAARVEAESQAALRAAGKALSPGQLLDQFRGGALSNPLASAVARLRGRWVHAGEVAPAVLAELQAGKLAPSARYGGLTQAAAALRVRPRAVEITTARSLAAFTPGVGLGLITDDALFAASARPDLVLRRYLDALSDDGELLLHLGNVESGAGASRVMTREGDAASLAGWLKSVKGLEVTDQPHAPAARVDDLGQRLSPAGVPRGSSGARAARALAVAEVPRSAPPQGALVAAAQASRPASRGRAGSGEASPREGLSPGRGGRPAQSSGAIP
jgi:hypothetical protein